MTRQLHLAEPRRVIDEPGGGVHIPLTGEPSAVREVLAAGYLSLTDAHYDPIAGHVCGVPDWTLTDMVSTAWTADVPGNWSAAGSMPGPDGTPAAFLAHKAAADFTLTENTPAPAGQGRLVSFITYDTQAGEGGTGTDSPITLTFGGVWRVELFDDGTAYLSELVDGSYRMRTQFDWQTSERFAPAVVWLWVYEVRNRLVIRNLSPSLQGRECGVVWIDDGAPEVPEVRDAAGNPIRHALREGVWSIAGGGYLTVNVSPQSWRPGTSRLTAQTVTADAWGHGSTRFCRATAHGIGTATVTEGEDGPEVSETTATVATTDENGDVWPQGDGTFAPVVRHAIGWSVEWETTADGTFFLSAVTVKIPRTTRLEGGAGTDLAAIAGVADRNVRLTREGDLTRERLSAEFLAAGNLAAYVQPNMSLRYVVGGTTRFRGLTSEAQWEVLADQSAGPVGTLRLQAEGLWRRFRKALYPGGDPFDGRLLTDCLAEVLDAAGLEPDDYELAAVDYRLPVAEAGEPPAVVYRPGTTVDRILEDLAENYYGTRLRHFFRLTDGKFVLAQVAGGGASVAAFWETTEAAALAGAPYQTIRAGSYTEALDDSEMYNAVIVIGQRSDGLPLLARAIDWSSVRDSSVMNYVGEVWPLVVADPSLQTRAAVNYVCRSLWDRHRFPRVTCAWTSHRVDVHPGDVVTLAGPDYGFDVTLSGVTLTQAVTGPEAGPLGLASYQGEKIL